MRDAIKKAAFALMAEKGLDKVSMREIAEKVNVTKPVLYYYFKIKRTCAPALLRTTKPCSDAKWKKCSSARRGPKKCCMKGCFRT